MSPSSTRRKRRCKRLLKKSRSHRIRSAWSSTRSPGWYGAATDIEDGKRAEMLLAGEKRLFEMIARGESRPLLLDALCRLVEELASGCIASVLLFDPNTNSLRHGSSPSLPPEYAEAIDGIVIGASVGSCGTAAY